MGAVQTFTLTSLTVGKKKNCRKSSMIARLLTQISHSVRLIPQLVALHRQETSDSCQRVTLRKVAFVITTFGISSSMRPQILSLRSLVARAMVTLSPNRGIN